MFWFFIVNELGDSSEELWRGMDLILRNMLWNTDAFLAELTIDISIRFQADRIPWKCAGVLWCTQFSQ